MSNAISTIRKEVHRALEIIMLYTWKDFLLKCPFKSGPGLVPVTALTLKAYSSALHAHTQYQTSLCAHRCC